MTTEKCKDESYEVTGKVCPPKMPMDNVILENWQNLPPPFLDSLFSEAAIEGSKIITSASLCALSSHASVVLSSDGLSHSSVTLPYYYCNFCDHNTASKLNLLKHIAGKHLFKCQMCDDFISFTRSGLIQHQLQKHVDAEEMQPVLCAKTVQFSTAELMRSIKYLKQFTHGQKGDAFNSSFTNNSQLKDSHSGSAENNFLTCVGSSNDLSSIEMKNPDTSVANIKKINNGVFNDVAVESMFEEAKSKLRLEKDEVMGTVDRNIPGFTLTEGNRNCPSLKYPQEMPHFLNDSDSSVTSSRLSPPSVCKPSQDTSWHSEKNVNDVQRHIHSFLTESSPAAKRSENVKSTYMIQKLLNRSGEKENIKDQSVKDCTIENSSSSPSSSSSICKKILTASEKNGETEKVRSSSPNLTSLSVERLQKQLEDAASNSPGFIFKASGSDCHNQSEHSSNAECKQKSTLHLPSGFKHWGADLKESHKPSENKMDNFLLDNEDFGSALSTPSTLIRSNSDCRHDTTIKNQPSITARLSIKGDNYDMLRNLLVQKPKEPVATHFRNSKKDSQLRLKCVKTASPIRSDMSSTSKADPNTCWARASDMSLKELLTGSVPQVNNVDADKVDKDNNLPSLPIFLVCGFCNFESHSKAHFDSHMEICKNAHNSQKESLSIVQNNSSTDTQFINCEMDIKQEKETSENCISQACSSKPPGDFSASGLLKSLTDQCLGFNLKTPRDNGNIHVKDNKSTHTFLNGSHSNGQSHLTFERRKDFSKSVNDIHSATRDNTYLSATMQSKASSLSPNFIFTDDVDRSRTDSSASTTRKRKHGYCEDTDCVYESDQNFESENSSDSDSRLYASKSCVDKNVNAEKICGMRSPMTKRACKKSLSKQPNLYLSCLNCSFSTANRADMRQHLITKHPSNVSFCRARFESQKDSLLYFCCGVKSLCTFFSTEGAEIFEHIKLCYSGHLDNFLDKQSDVCNYAPVLYSLGISAKKLNSSPSMFYCLTCSFANSNFQRVAHHVNINHPDKVAGVMHINKTLPEAVALMVCLSCNSHVLVKHWATHPCRKADSVFHNGAASFMSTSKTFNRSGALQGNTDQGKVSLLCELMAAEKGKIVECCSERAEKIKPDSVIKSTNVMDSLPCNLPEPVQSNSGEELFIKQEILDVEDSSDVPFNDNTDHGAFDINGKSEVNTNYSQAVELSGFSNTDLNKSSSHSRVLQTLLSTPNEGSAMPKSISLLQNLLSSTEVMKEKSGLPLIPKSLSNSHVSPVLASQSQYSTMLESLSRQASHSSLNAFAKPENIESRKNSVGASNDSRNASTLPKLELKESLKPDSVIISVRKNSSSNLQTSLIPIEGVRVSPQATTRPPLLPLIPPLSPLQSEENLSSHAPFSNLLRGLLCKVYPKPAHS